MEKKLYIVMLVLAGVVVAMSSGRAQQSEQTQRIAIPDLKKKLDSGDKFLLIDVREDSELQADGAIPGAVHIAVGELDSRMKDIPKDVDLVFYCGGGTRAEAAAKKFLAAGYKAGLFCGIRDWKKENEKVVPAVDRPAAGPIQPK